MHIITIGNLKGGVGKTTTTVNLADGLGRNGNRVLVIDADPQGNCSSILLTDIHEREERSLVRALEAPAGEGNLTSMICRSSNDRVDLVPNNFECILWERHVVNTSDATFGFHRLLKNDRDLEKYDYILIDTPPNIGAMLTNALIISDYSIVPVPVPDQFALDSLAIFLRVMQNTRNQNQRLRLLGILLTKHDDRVPLYVSNREKILQFFAAKGANVFRTSVRLDVAIDKAHMKHQTIFELDPDSIGALDHESLAREIVEILHNEQSRRKRN
ncbi:MAG: ParA family protein [Desulfobacteraceae bacterium]|nr:MAG: ParA family protein [Desulfobacteraceae bacterium]